MGVEQKPGAGSKPHTSRVVSKSDNNHGSATTANRTLGLTPAGTICRSNLSLSYIYSDLILCPLVCRKKADMMSDKKHDKICYDLQVSDT